MVDLTQQQTHFAFGENWRSFAALVDDQKVAASDAGIDRMFQPGELTGRSVIDIGCGSGLPALSLLRRGAAHVTCVDIDTKSVDATRSTLTRFAPADVWSTALKSVFDLTGSYDIVYSWGVLHHTGDMWRAIDKASSLVKPGGLIAIAIYCKTPLCGFWRVEKAFYSKLPRPLQFLVQSAFTAWRIMLAAVLTRKPFAFMRAKVDRGMDWWHDQHDWLGGYPYESATPDEVQRFMVARGFSMVRENLMPGSRRGLTGSGCDEYVFRRPA